MARATTKSSLPTPLPVGICWIHVYPRVLFRASKSIINVSNILSVNLLKFRPQQFSDHSDNAVSRLPISILSCARAMKTTLLFTSSRTKGQMTI